MATIPRLHVEFALVPGGEGALDGAQSNYIARVMRLGEGAPVRLFNGRDGEWRALVDAVSRQAVTVRVDTQTRAQPPQSGRRIDLWFAPVKKARTDFIVEKATELGVHTIQPVITERTQSERVRADRLARIALEAAEQTERLNLPEVHDPVTLAAALAGLGDGMTVIFCDEAGDDEQAPWVGARGRADTIADVIGQIDSPGVVLLVGPEGGFAPHERTNLRAHPHIRPVTLGPRILRAETAVVSALAVWQSMVGDWR